MSITPKSQTAKRELIPAGTHIARLYQIVEIGTTYYEWQGEQKESYKVRLTWELPNLTKVFKEEEGPKPLVISEEYTLSMGEKSNLRPVVEGITGPLTDKEANGFNLESLLGTTCLLNVGHKTSKKGATFERVLSTSPLMAGMTAPDQVNPSKSLSFENFDEELFNKLPDFIKTKISETPEYKKLKGVEEESDPDAIPF